MNPGNVNQVSALSEQRKIITELLAQGYRLHHATEVAARRVPTPAQRQLAKRAGKQ